MKYDFFYGSQSESFSFYRIPRILITDPTFRCLSSGAKFLYGLLLDRMGLSARNGWFDEQSRVFIYYPLAEIEQDLGCGHDKATKLLRELDTETGIGLIERVKQGLGRPTRIYVKSFSSARNDRTPDCGEPAPQTAEKPHSGPREISSQDCGKPAANYINNNYTEENYTDLSYIHPSIHPENEQAGAGDGWDGYDLEERIREKIEYDILVGDGNYRTEELDGIVGTIRDVLRGIPPKLQINRTEIDGTTLQSVFRKITRDHVEYVLDSLAKTTTEITDMRRYLLTSLYNAVLYMDLHVSAQVRHDMRGGQ